MEKEKTEQIPPKPKEIPKPVANCDGKGMCVVGIVQRVIDGDTLIIDKYIVRLSLTNAPEKNQAGFKEATAFTSKLCRIGSYAIFDQDNRQPMDKYGRVIGKVTCNAKVLNSELVTNGHATILKQYCIKSEYAKESWAKKNGC
jgi:endonuclease YncB( thermonuclease family)